MNRLLLLLLTSCLVLPGCWQKDCSKWPFISAEEYWLRVRNGYGYELLETREEYICLAIQGDHDRWYRRVDRKLLTREVQEKTYRLIVQRTIAQLKKKELARRATIDPRRLIYVQQSIDRIMRQLEDYTELHFDAPEQWLRWWEENHERLRLASDGRHVTVGS